MQAASNNRRAKVPVPILTAIGARAMNPFAIMRIASPGRNPSSANRRPSSTSPKPSPADTDTTRAQVPAGRSASRISATRAASWRGANTSVAGAVNMNAILYEHRSNYHSHNDAATHNVARSPEARAALRVPATLGLPRLSEAYDMPTLFEKI